MARVTAIRKPSEYPGTPDEVTRQDLAELFATLFPGVPDPAFDGTHDGLAIAAQNPKLALHLARLSGFIAGQLPWCQHRGLRELAIQALNLHFKSGYSFQSRVHHAEAAGISAVMLAALPFWKTSSLFDEEQRLTIEYTNAVVTGEVPEELFARVVRQFGEKGAVECTALVAFWSFWAMMLNATRP
jgi:alkylhydroperoxidase family enzyme